MLLPLLCAVQFLDVVDSSIVNVALPSIRRDLGFSTQSGLSILTTSFNSGDDRNRALGVWGRSPA